METTKKLKELRRAVATDIARVLWWAGVRTRFTRRYMMLRRLEA